MSCLIEPIESRSRPAANRDRNELEADAVYFLDQLAASVARTRMTADELIGLYRPGMRSRRRLGRILAKYGE